MRSPLNISISDVEVVAWNLGGSGKQGVPYKNFLKDWCNRFYLELEHLQDELVHWSEWLANNHPPLGIHLRSDGMPHSCPRQSTLGSPSWHWGDYPPPPNKLCPVGNRCH